MGGITENSSSAVTLKSVVLFISLLVLSTPTLADFQSDMKCAAKGVEADVAVAQSQWPRVETLLAEMVALGCKASDVDQRRRRLPAPASAALIPPASDPRGGQGGPKAAIGGTTPAPVQGQPTVRSPTDDPCALVMAAKPGTCMDRIAEWLPTAPLKLSAVELMTRRCAELAYIPTLVRGTGLIDEGIAFMKAVPTTAIGLACYRDAESLCGRLAKAGGDRCSKPTVAAIKAKIVGFEKISASADAAGGDNAVPASAQTSLRAFVSWLRKTPDEELPELWARQRAEEDKLAGVLAEAAATAKADQETRTQRLATMACADRPEFPGTSNFASYTNYEAATCPSGHGAECAGHTFSESTLSLWWSITQYCEPNAGTDALVYVVSRPRGTGMPHPAFRGIEGSVASQDRGVIAGYIQGTVLAAMSDANSCGRVTPKRIGAFTCSSTCTDGPSGPTRVRVFCGTEPWSGDMLALGARGWAWKK